MVVELLVIFVGNQSSPSLNEKGFVFQ